MARWAQIPSAWIQRSAVLVAAAALCAVLAASASAAVKPRAMVGISDPVATGPTAGLLEAFAPRWRAAGVDLASVTADWREIAPEKDSKVPPAGFDGGDPSSPLYNWANLDRVINVLRANKLEPLLTITGPGPLWTSTDPERGSARYRPDPVMFAAFARAVALRYGARVGRYIVWYEPNDAANLRPQWYCTRGACAPRSPQIYRAIFNSAASAIRGADGGSEVLAGALAARGRSAPEDSDDPLTPVAWLRAFGCVDSDGVADRNAPTCDEFEPASVDGLAYHPDQRGGAPSKHLRNTAEAGINDTPRLTRVLDQMQLSGGIVNAADASAPIDLYFSEWGYQTNPPDVFSGVSLQSQDKWLQEGAKIVYGQPRVKLLGQYLWRDQPVRDSGQGVDAYSGGQSGLYGFDGIAKPAASSFPNPFWAISLVGSRAASLWGQVRPGGAHTVAIERRIGRNRYRQVASVETDGQGYFRSRLPLSTTAKFRYWWTPSSGSKKRRYSDSISVRPR
jgi:hypothetical protein